jgi:hypothetical protein
MLPASTIGGGQCMIFPDVCKTPAPPAPFIVVPYPNVAQLTDGKGGTFSKKVLICGDKTATTKSEISRSSGDEAGTLKGVVSQTNMGPAKFTKGSGKVTAEGSPVTHVTSTIGQNGVPNANCPAGVQVAPSQTTVFVAP